MMTPGRGRRRSRAGFSAAHNNKKGTKVKRWIVLLGSVSAVACLLIPAVGATWYVDGSVPASGDGKTPETAFKRIQEGIDAASSGDTVIVAQGTYVENIRFGGKNIVLRSADPTNTTVVENTIVDGNQAGSVVAFDGTENETCVLSGFSIRNGKADEGGGIFAGGQAGTYVTSATVQNNRITNNSAAFNGGGLCNCWGVVRNNVIAANSTAGYGGGLAYCGGVVENNVISDNVALWAGGIWGSDYGGEAVRNNTISGNSAEYGGGGMMNVSGIVEGNTITANSTAGNGGAVGGAEAIITGNTISGNSAQGNGGGLYACTRFVLSNIIMGNSAGGDGGGAASCAVIQNNLIAGNSAKRGGGVANTMGTIQNNTIVNNSVSGSKSVGGGLAFCTGVIRNCIIWGNTAEGSPSQLYGSSTPLFSCIEDWPGGGKENISDDPMFADAAGGDCHLTDGSRCIDTGADYYWFAWPQRDPDGNCRLAGDHVDMGCYEHGGSADTDGDLLADEDEGIPWPDPVKEDTDGDGLRDGLEVLRGTNPGEYTHPGTVTVTPAGPSVQKALCLAVMGDQIVILPGTYHENVQFCGCPWVTVRSMDPEGPDTVAATILDGGGFGPVVSFEGGLSEYCELAGLTIQNGLAGVGGGICGTGGSGLGAATIRNNIIKNNVATLLAGGGIAYCVGPIRGNIIAGNSCVGAGTEGGGGLAYCSGTIDGNAIMENIAEGNGGGLVFCAGTIQNNIIAGNAANFGGGLHECDGTICNNTIHGNTAEKGGGLSRCNGTLLNCIVWGNETTSGGHLSFCAVPNYSCIEAWTGGGWENISTDPQISDPDGPDNDPDTYEDNDYHLAEGSPCIDAGGNEDWMWSAVDLEGNPRIFPVRSEQSWKVDMGAYEYIPADYPLTACIRATEGGVQIVWTSHPGESFAVSSCDDMLTGAWSEETAGISSTGLTTTWTYTPPATYVRFYRAERE
jgi:hypothetical protein